MVQYRSSEIIKILEKKGFILSRIKGSHHIYFNTKSGKRVIVPLHKKDLPKGTFYTILKQAGISRKDLNDL
jgi:predicted RNA binding protein YcfA (HicA-like mRNA interferase family)